MNCKIGKRALTLALILMLGSPSTHAMAVKVDEEATEKAFEDARSVIF